MAVSTIKGLSAMLTFNLHLLDAATFCVNGCSKIAKLRQGTRGTKSQASLKGLGSLQTLELLHLPSSPLLFGPRLRTFSTIFHLSQIYSSHGRRRRKDHLQRGASGDWTTSLTRSRHSRGHPNNHRARLQARIGSQPIYVDTLVSITCNRRHSLRRGCSIE